MKRGGGWGGTVLRERKRETEVETKRVTLLEILEIINRYDLAIDE